MPSHWLVLTKRLPLKCIHGTTEFSCSEGIWHHYFCLFCCWLASKVNAITRIMGQIVRRIVWSSINFHWPVVARGMLFFVCPPAQQFAYFSASSIPSFAITAAALPLAWMLPWNSWSVYFETSFGHLSKIIGQLWWEVWSIVSVVHHGIFSYIIH